MKTLLLIDGTAVAYRAFYAIRELSTSGGRPTNAVYGFIRMLRQMERIWQPTHRIVVFDGGLPEDRMAALETYKAQRPDMPDPLQDQLPDINEYLERAGMAAVLLEQYEADDVMATLTRQAREAEAAEILLATSDKDLYQLVNNRVFIIPPTKSDVRMGPKEIEEKTGVAPERIVDWLAMVGDSSDNIPGVPGVGAKTAARLIREFGSVARLYERLAEVKSERIRSALEANRDIVMRNIGLMTLGADLPCTIDWEAAKVREPDPEKLLSFFTRLEFHAMARELEE